jgi:hypothetical protein
VPAGGNVIRSLRTRARSVAAAQSLAFVGSAPAQSANSCTPGWVNGTTMLAMYASVQEGEP